tara:strand:- start:351 stop:551 length:201 start_codon:yes stop_codon:yes gene_type:complete
MKNCRICSYIRYFLAFVLLLIIISLTFKENLGYLSFVTPWNAAILIFILGCFLFLFKLIEYLNQKD